MYVFRRSISTASTASYSSCDSQIADQREIKYSQTMAIVEATANAINEIGVSDGSGKSGQNGEKKASLQSVASNPLDRIFNRNDKKKSSSASSIRSSIFEFGRKHGVSLGRHKYPEKPRNFRYEFMKLNLPYLTSLFYL